MGILFLPTWHLKRQPSGGSPVYLSSPPSARRCESLFRQQLFQPICIVEIHIGVLASLKVKGLLCDLMLPTDFLDRLSAVGFPKDLHDLFYLITFSFRRSGFRSQTTSNS